MRAENIIERLIARQCIADLLAAGHHVSVNDGEETTLRLSRDPAAIYAAMFTTDEDRLIANDEHGNRVGWIYFVYGNSGWDTLNDWTTDLDGALKPTLTLVDDLQTREGIAKVANRFAIDGAQQPGHKAYDLLAWCRTFITERHLNAEFEAHTGQTIDAIDDVLGPIGDAPASDIVREFATPAALMTAEGRFVIRKTDGVYAVHWQNLQTRGFIEGHYHVKLSEAANDFAKRVARWCEAYGATLDAQEPSA